MYISIRFMLNIKFTKNKRFVEISKIKAKELENTANKSQHSSPLYLFLFLLEVPSHNKINSV